MSAIELVLKSKDYSLKQFSNRWRRVLVEQRLSVGYLSKGVSEDTPTSCFSTASSSHLHHSVSHQHSVVELHCLGYLGFVHQQ